MYSKINLVSEICVNNIIKERGARVNPFLINSVANNSVFDLNSIRYENRLLSKIQVKEIALLKNDIKAVQQRTASGKEKTVFLSLLNCGFIL